MNTRAIHFLFLVLVIMCAPRHARAQERSVLRLTLKSAVETALSPEGNPRLRLAEEAVRQAEARSAQSRAALLPNLEASVSQQSITRNLQAFGIRFDIPIAGFTAPTFVGPFNVFDARATASVAVFDLSAIRRFQASRSGVLQARTEAENADDQVRELVARLYLAAVRAEATFETARANVALAERLVKLAEDQKAVGTGTGVEVTRARVQLANENQRLLVAETERARGRLQLLRAMGLNLDTPFELAEGLSYRAVELLTPAQAMAIALKSRSDWKAQQQRELTARLAQSAVALERVPSVHAFGDYGSIGSSIGNTIPTRTYGASVRIPLFDGGRRDARSAESASQFRQERVRSLDLRAGIELDVRLALDNLRSAEAQVRTAEEGMTLAEGELAQAERRYEAGMTSSIEVADAQTRLQRARDNRIAALFAHNIARIDLAAATGMIRNIVQ